MMKTTDDKLLQHFFTENRQEINDDGFSRRIMSHLPNRYYRISQIWTFCCFTLALVLFVLLDGAKLVLETLRETFTVTIQNNVTELDPKSLIIALLVVLCLVYRKICSLA